MWPWVLIPVSSKIRERGKKERKQERIHVMLILKDFWH
jgi:hypothetical protein